MNIKATFKNGVFRPLEEVSLPEGTNVSLDITSEAPEAASPPVPAEPAWMKHVGRINDEDAALMKCAIEEACGQVDHEKW